MNQQSLKDHADTLLFMVCQNFADAPGNTLLDIWEDVQDTMKGESSFELQRSLRSLLHWLEDRGDNFECTALRFYLWQNSTDSEVQADMANRIRKSTSATEYMREQVMEL